MRVVVVQVPAPRRRLTARIRAVVVVPFMVVIMVVMIVLVLSTLALVRAVRVIMVTLVIMIVVVMLVRHAHDGREDLSSCPTLRSSRARGSGGSEEATRHARTPWIEASDVAV
jgi:amino acid permease